MQVRVDAVSKTYHGRRGVVEALRQVSFTIGDGEFVSILGPSGCGKSTLLNIIAGLTPATGGTVHFQGMTTGQPRPLTAVVFQEFALFPWRTVLENVTFGLEMRGVPRAERQARARQYIELVGLQGFEAKYPRELSGGMKQRVGIARALVMDPEVLLMDEPLSALDAQTRTLMQVDLLRIWESTRKSVLYVTHNIQEAAFLSDRIIVLSRRPGRLHTIIDVPFARPRDESLMADGTFHAFAQEIWQVLKDQARAAMVEGDE